MKEDLYSINLSHNKGNDNGHNKPKEKLGNSLGVGVSRPRLFKSSRQAQMRSNKLVEQHMTDDIGTISAAVYRKGLPIHEAKCNTQSRNYDRSKTRKRHTPKAVELTRFREKLYVTNYEYVYHITPQSVIINMSSHKITARNHSLKFTDSDEIKYREFLAIMRRSQEIMNAVPESDSIYLVCDKGVNRSVTIAIAYAIMQKKWKFYDARDYIEKEKATLGYSSWDTLTNSHFAHFLQLIEKENT